MNRAGMSISDAIKTLDGYRQQIWNTTSNWREIWQGGCDFVLPQYGDVENVQLQGTTVPPDTEHLLDAIGVEASDRLASNMNSLMNGRAVPWFMVTLDNPSDMKKPKAKKYLAQMERHAYHWLGLSNFYKEMAASWALNTGINTSVLYKETDFERKKTKFKCYPPWQFTYTLDDEGRVEFGFLSERMSAMRIVQKWKNAKDIECIQKIMAKNPLETVEVKHAVGPKEFLQDGLMGNEQHNYFSIYYVEDGKNKEILNQTDMGKIRGYKRMPYFVQRWSPIASMDLGWGPGLRAVADLKQLCNTHYWKRLGIPLAIRGLYVTDTDDLQIGHNGEVEPGSVIATRTGARFERLPVEGDLRLAELDINDQRNAIRRGFYWDEILLFPDRPEMTRAEFLRRVEMAQRLFNIPAEMTQQDVFDPLLTSLFADIEEAYQMERPVSLQGRDMELRYIGPLARAQQLPEIQAARDVVANVIQMANSAQKPELMEAIDFYEFISRDFDGIGAPLEILTERADFDKKVLEFQQALQRQAEAEIGKTQAQAGQSAAKAIGEMAA